MSRGLKDGYLRYRHGEWIDCDGDPVEIELVVHAHWEDIYGGKYDNPRYRCSRCKRKAMYRMEQDVLLSWKEVQELTPRCSYCGAHMDEEVVE